MRVGCRFGSCCAVDGSADPPDVCVIELGGTVGDIESMPFVEALRQFIFRKGPRAVCVALVSLVPLAGVNEQKTKPTQHCVKDLRGLGMSPDVIFCRCAEPVQPDIRVRSILSLCCCRQCLHESCAIL